MFIAERTTDAGKPFLKPATKKRKLSITFAKIDKALEAFVSYQQAADRSFLAAEEARERREEEREEKRWKVDQEFLLRLAQVLRNEKYAFSTISFALVPATVSARLVFGFIHTLS